MNHLLNGPTNGKTTRTRRWITTNERSTKVNTLKGTKIVLLHTALIVALLLPTSIMVGMAHAEEGTMGHEGHMAQAEDGGLGHEGHDMAGHDMASDEMDAVEVEAKEADGDAAPPDLDLDAVADLMEIPLEGAQVTGADGATSDAEGAVEPNSRIRTFVVSGTIYPMTKVDGWILNNVSAGDSICITMNKTSGNLDTYLRLYDPYNRMVAYNDDFGGTTDSRITTGLSASGRYVIYAYSYSHASAGAYRLNITVGTGARCPDNPEDPPPPPPPPPPGCPGSCECGGGEGCQCNHGSCGSSCRHQCGGGCGGGCQCPAPQPPPDTQCRNLWDREPILVYDLSGGGFAELQHCKLTVYDDGLATIAEMFSWRNPDGSATYQVLPASTVERLRRDLSNAGAYGLCDEPGPVYDNPLQTVTFFQSPATRAEANTASTYLPQGQSWEWNSTLNTIERFRATHFPDYCP